MKIVRNLDEDVWRRFVDDHPDGNVFHTPEMFRVFSRVKGHQPQLWAVVEGEETLALLLPVQITLMGGLLRRFTTRSVVYGGVLVAPGAAGEAALRLLLDGYARETQDVLFTEVRNLSDTGHLQAILDDGKFVYEGHLNYLIDLDCPAETILQRIGKRTRKQIRKGLRDQIVQMDEVSDLSDLAHWYQTLQKTYTNAQVPLADFSLFEAAYEELHPKGMAKFLLARVDGVTAACSIELPYKDTIYGWYGGSDRAYSRYLPNEMLIWHILVWGANNGYRVYDFGGAGKPDEEYGVRDFKAKFGGELVNFGRNVYVASPEKLRLSELGYKLYQRFL